MAKTSKCDKLELTELFMSRLEGDSSEVAAHQILGKLAKKLEVSKLGVICTGDDDPVLKAAVMSCSPVAELSGFENILLASIKKRGTLVAGEREAFLCGGSVNSTTEAQ